MRLFYTYPRLKIYVQRKIKTIKSISFPDVNNCVFCLQIESEFFVL